MKKLFEVVLRSIENIDRIFLLIIEKSSNRKWRNKKTYKRLIYMEKMQYEKRDTNLL
ncbi:hypothetical protein [Clostridium beijerinckii]|uniref:hypothetical protein n=1 Tax=Clostridium beijerinckii TaxID=1520 RepID=UPI00156E4F7F|nr:hypothetical protein [Clostridium beijerinckii]MBC2490083.1 hypothetical protein [Clostridium beijerinckii]NRT04921.1 hypothetical protein [Clostridium beijerinckii]NRU13994.1 hypothetical protein [Clostridium beijerinckii]NRU15484.1 hypothetical protein [Clostridium beijerinckii]NRU58215.1 hypothetical protein [Clostridium beijerinckii]